MPLETYHFKLPDGRRTGFALRRDRRRNGRRVLAIIASPDDNSQSVVAGEAASEAKARTLAIEAINTLTQPVPLIPCSLSRPYFEHGRWIEFEIGVLQRTGSVQTKIENEVEASKPLRNRRTKKTYFVGAEGCDFVKIGTTRKPMSVRLAGLQTGCPFKLHLLCVTEADERLIHKVFEASRFRGEWFQKTDGLMALVEYINAGNKLPRSSKKLLQITQ